MSKLSLRKASPILSRYAELHIHIYSEVVTLSAIEAASFGFQMRHIPPCLVNMITFQEIVFSSSKAEITHQWSERIAWYLEPRNASARLETYEKFKSIYGARSQIVHGVNHMKKPQDIKKALLDAEFLNKRILQEILQKRHVALFSKTITPSSQCPSSSLLGSRDGLEQHVYKSPLPRRKRMCY